MPHILCWFRGWLQVHVSCRLRSGNAVMQQESYLQTLTASSQRHRAEYATQRLKRKVRVHLRRSRRNEPSVVSKALVLLAVVCVVYAIAFALTQKADPSPNIVTAPRGIATFFQKF
ncbi:MAG: hypothetical protein KDJ55_05280 [Rhodobiaceae bacterium]|nr:hypothetical protein [Rhodobiaceae bacterium]MCC0012328.1 hypothetical protein [Rhodobiaceae bacterium]MCC0019106.1 hypothetical protein [Rhodobiaceae bacterium]MCC0051954.1 hypothetical protein [Rhodobiaceae bacterium]